MNLVVTKTEFTSFLLFVTIFLTIFQSDLDCNAVCGLYCTVSMTTKSRPCQTPAGRSTFSTAELRFRDGLVWTVALTVENKAEF